MDHVRYRKKENTLNIRAIHCSSPFRYPHRLWHNVNNHAKKSALTLFWLWYVWLFSREGELNEAKVKVSSRVKNHHFSKFAIFRRLNRAHQELSFKTNSRKKCFFCADLWSAKVFSVLLILIDCWQVLSYLIRVPLLNQANHAIWQKSFSLEFESECLQRRKKSLSVFVLDHKTKEDDKIVWPPKSGLRN